MPKPNVQNMEELLQGVTETIRARVHPEKIILFGSRARNEARANSDIDLLVVLPTQDKGKTALDIRMGLEDLPVAIDVVVCSPQEFRRYRDVPGTVIKPAWREGRYLYGEPEAWVVQQEPPPYGEIAKPTSKRAQDDLQVAKVLLESGKDFALDSICFHAQQAAEKYMKAALIYLGIDPARTHDLETLALQLPAETQTTLIPKELKHLSSFAVESRYGQTATCPDPKAARFAIEAAERVHRVVSRHLVGS